jgi:hypothetical protein
MYGPGTLGIEEQYLTLFFAQRNKKGPANCIRDPLGPAVRLRGY